MSIEHILTEIFNKPLFVTPDKLNVVLDLLGQKSGNPFEVDFSKLLPTLGSDANKGSIEAKARPVNESQETRIAVVSALGSLVYRTGGNPNAGSGMRSYRYMKMDIQECLGAREVDGMLIDFNSYGGSAQGCESMARFIREADAQKPIYGLVDMNCFSAAYYLAAACRRVVLADQDCGVGSIGCIAIHRDQSQRNEQEGDVYTAVYFGDEKNNFSPHEPLTEQSRDKLQRSVNRFGLQFVKTVAEFRSLSEKTVIGTQAGVFYGNEAIDLGLADEIATFDEAVAMLAADIGQENRKHFHGGSAMTTEAMTTKERMQKLLAADDGPEAIADLGYIKKDEAEKATAEAVEAAGKKTIDVAELCQLGSLSVDNTVSILKQGLTAEEARTAIQKIKAVGSHQTTVKSNVTPVTGDGKHPLIASCEKMAKDS